MRVPTPESITLANGLTVMLAPRRGLPVVAANLVVKTGSDSNPADAPGLANFAAAMLTQGTKTRNALQIADDIAQLGATLTATSTMDASTISTRSLKKNFSAALDQLADVALNPSFPADELERQRTVRLGQLAQQRANPQALAANDCRQRALRRRASVWLCGDRHRGIVEGDDRAIGCARSGSRTSCRTTRR